MHKKPTARHSESVASSSWASATTGFLERLYAEEVKGEGAEIDAVVGRMAGTGDR
jgi:hypothetical protein